MKPVLKWRPPRVRLPRLPQVPRAAMQSPPYLRVVEAFQPDAAEIEARTPPRIARLTLYLVAALIVGAVAWASLASVDEIITARGKLITTRPDLVVQPLETSMVRDIQASVGDIVHTGDVLAVLDPTFTQSDVGQLQGRIGALNAEISRLEAELAGSEYLAPANPSPDEELQAQLFVQRRRFFDASLHNYDEQIAKAEAEIATNEGEEGEATRVLSVMNQIESMRGTLAERQDDSRLNVLESRAARLNASFNLSRIRGSEAELAHTLEKTRAERQAFIEEFRRTAMEQLVEARAKRGPAEEELRKAQLRRQMVVLTAPADAVVLDVAHRSIGSVVKEAETLFVLVPLDTPLEAEVQLDGKDVGRVAVGQPVRVKFDAFPFQKHGTAAGQVRLISRDSFTPESSAAAGPGTEGKEKAQPYYRVRVALNDLRLRAIPDGFQMIPGMSLVAETKVGRRKVISYFLYPLLRGLDESIREP